jgi:hypothetical protein
MKTVISLSALLFACSIDGSDVKDYSVDQEGAYHLNSSEPPTRVDIHLAGPMKGDDPTLTWLILHGSPPAYSTTNRAEITNLVSIIRKNDNLERIPNVQWHLGYTYHVLLFRDTSKSVIHFRVFEPVDTNTVWCMVYPRSRANSFYFNAEIGRWLHTRLTVNTNQIPVASTIGTNGPLTSPTVATNPIPTN